MAGGGHFEGSIVYDTRLIYDDAVSNTYLRLVYAAVICLPLLASSEARVRVFGVLITLSVLVSFLFATYAFTSVWCYLAAVVSAYVAFVVFQLPRRTGEPAGDRAAELVK